RDITFNNAVKNIYIRTSDVAATDYYANSGGDGIEVDVPALWTSMTSLVIDTGSSNYSDIYLGGADDSSVLNTTVHTGGGQHDRVTASALDSDANPFNDVDGAVELSV